MNTNWNAAGNPMTSEPRIAKTDDPVRPESDDFDRFHALAGALVQVPKESVATEATKPPMPAQ